MNTWDRLERTFDRLQPQAIRFALNLPASRRAVRQAELDMGLVFPSDLREAYLTFDGVDTSRRWDRGMEPEAPHVFLRGLDWVCLAEVVRLWRWERGQEAVEAGSGLAFEPAKTSDVIRPRMFDPLWIPIGDADCHERVFVDLNPGPAGVVGQVISRSLSGRETRWIAESFRAYVDRLLDAVEDGRLIANPDWGWTDTASGEPAAGIPT